MPTPTSKKSKTLCESIIKKIDAEIPMHGYASKAQAILAEKGVKRTLHQIRHTRQGRTYDLVTAQALVEVVEKIKKTIEFAVQFVNDEGDGDGDDNERLHPAVLGLRKKHKSPPRL